MNFLLWYQFLTWLLTTLKIARNATNSKRDWVAVALDDLMTLDAVAIYGFLCKHLVAVFVLRVIAFFYVFLVI